MTRNVRRSWRPGADDPDDDLVLETAIARASRAIPGQAKTILARSGIGNPPRPDDQIE